MTDVCFRKVQLDVDFAKFVTAEYSQAPLDSPIEHQRRDLAWLYEPYGGYPDSFIKDNTGLQQLWWSPEDIDYDALGDELGMEVVTVSSLKQNPGNVIPLHIDAFYRLRQSRPNDDTAIPVRANIFLEDSDIGHMLQFVVGDEVVSATDWRAGQGYLFDKNVPHLSSNAGLRPKYTLQVSGFLKRQEQ